MDALVSVAHKRRLNGEKSNVSALIRTILRNELTQEPPPPETYGQIGGDGPYTVRMPPDLLEELESLADQLGIEATSSLIRSMLRRWLVENDALPGRVHSKKKKKVNV